MATRRRKAKLIGGTGTNAGLGGTIGGVTPVPRARASRRRNGRARGTSQFAMPRSAGGDTQVSTRITGALQKLGLLKERANTQHVTAAIDLCLGNWTS